jgi:hypothetical protein
MAVKLQFYLMYPHQSRDAISRLQHRKDRDQISSARIRLQWHHIVAEQDGDHAVVRDSRRLFRDIKTLPLLESVHLEIYCSGRRVVPAEAITALLRLIQPGKLVSLRINDCLLSGTFGGFWEALKRQMNLERLELINFSPLPCAMSQLFSLIELLSTFPKLKSFGFADMFHLNCGDELTASLIKLAKNPCIENLQLAHCKSLRAEHILVILQMLCTNKHIRLLDLSGCDAVASQHDCYKLLGYVLNVNPALEELSIPMSDEDMILPVILSLAINRRLVSLHFTFDPKGNKSTVPSQKVIGALVKILHDQNYTLTHLTSDGWNISDKVVEYYLKLNRAGRSLLLHDDTKVVTTDKDWVAKIIDHSNDIDVVFYFLLKNPSMIVAQTCCPSADQRQLNNKQRKITS